MDSFERIWQRVRQDRNLVPRDYQTMGGMWTVDTWQQGEVSVQLMDEGWTRRIRAPGVDAIQSGLNEVTFFQGNGEELDRIWRTME